MTTGHAFYECDDQNSSDVVYQGKSEDTIGTPWDFYGDINLDFALVNESSDSEIENGFADEVRTHKYSTVDISGHVTEDGLHDRVGSTVVKYGARTCRETGPIDEIRDSGRCESSGADEIYYEICSGPGDSGAPYFETWEDSGGCEWAVIIGNHRGSPLGNNSESFGYAAHDMVSENDIEFGPTWSGTCGPIS